MALAFNLPSQIVVQTAAQWAADATVYSAKRILVTSDEFYGNSDQRRFKLADGTQTWSNLNYFGDYFDNAIFKDKGTGNIVDFLSGSDISQMTVGEGAITFNPNADGITEFGGDMYYSLGTPINLTSSTNNLNIGTSIVVNLTATGAQDLTGLVAQQGKVICLYNSDSVDIITLKNNSASSTSGNRFDFYPIEDFLLQPKQMIFLVNINAKWRVVGNQLASTTKTGLLTSTDWNTFNNKQDALVSGTNIKTINGTSVLGSGDIVVGGGLTVGTSTITGGTNTRILYNNSGVVGEYTVTGTGTVVALQTSPAFLTSTTLTAITATTTAADVLETITNNSSGIPAANYGLSRSIKLKSSTTDSQDAALEKFYWQTSTHATRKSAYALQLVHNGVLQDVFKVDYGSSSTTPEFRFIANSGNYARLQFMAGATAKGIVECFNDFYYITQTAGGAHYWLAGNYGAGMNLTTTALTLDNAVNLAFNTTTGSKIGTTTSQKLAFWNKTPIIQPTTGITAAAFVANTSLTANDTATFGGYTIGQIAAALINVGILA